MCGSLMLARDMATTFKVLYLPELLATRFGVWFIRSTR